MGWDFTLGATKQDVINEVTATWKSEIGTEHTCIAKRCVGNHLWTVWSTDNEKPNYIVLFLLAKNKNFGYGYKDIGEECGPAYYDCPHEFFKLAPPPDSKYCQDWRQSCKDYAKQKQMVKNMQPGRVFVYNSRTYYVNYWQKSSIIAAEITSNKPFRFGPSTFNYIYPECQ